MRWFTVCPTTHLTFDLHAAKVNLTGTSPDGHDSCNNIKMFAFTYEVVTFSGQTQCAALVGSRLLKQTTAWGFGQSRKFLPYNTEFRAVLAELPETGKQLQRAFVLDRSNLVFTEAQTVQRC